MLLARMLREGNAGAVADDDPVDEQLRPIASVVGRCDSWLLESIRVAETGGLRRFGADASSRRQCAVSTERHDECNAEL
jgi:hypothetical protein